MACSNMIEQYKRANDSLSNGLGPFGRDDYYERKRQFRTGDNKMFTRFVYAPKEHTIQRHQTEDTQVKDKERQLEINAAQQKKYVKESRNEMFCLTEKNRCLTKKIKHRDLKTDALLHLIYGDRINISVHNEMIETYLKNKLRKTLKEKHDKEAKLKNNITFLKTKIEQLEKELGNLRTKYSDMLLEGLRRVNNSRNELPVHTERRLPEKKAQVQQEDLHEIDATLDGTITSRKTKRYIFAAKEEPEDLGTKSLEDMVDKIIPEEFDINRRLKNTAEAETGDQLTKLEIQFKEPDDLISSLKENIQHLEEEAGYRDMKIKQLEKKLESNRTISEVDKQEMKEKDEKLHNLRDEMNLALRQKDETEMTLRGDISSLTDTIQHFKNEVQQRDRMIKDLEVIVKNREVSQMHNNKQSNNVLLKENEAQLSALRNKLLHKSKELKDKEDVMNEEIVSLKKKLQQLENEASNRDLEVKGLKEMLDNTNKGTTDLKQPNKDIAEKKISKLKKQLQHTLAILTETENELDETKTRLSKAMADRLTDNNPNIADLSDRNRPTKLAERYAELYDNQWTDAFDLLFVHFRGEEDTIEALLKILQDAMFFCKTKGQKQMTELKRVLEFSDKQGHGGHISADMYKVLKDNRKAMAAVAVENLYQMYESHLKYSTDETLKTALKVCSFTKECLEICWLMVIQDPSVVLAPLLRRGKIFNTDLFKPYTRSGTEIDYVVWPALLLYEGGPLLAKGVAQGYNKKKQKSKQVTSSS